MKRKVLLLLTPLLIAATALDAFESVTNAFRAGDAKLLASFFGQTIDLTLLDKEDVYSKGQAEMMLKDFFSRNPPKNFQIVHKGNSQEGTQYGIGHLSTTNGKEFRVTFNSRSSGGKLIINDLRIELD